MNPKILALVAALAGAPAVALAGPLLEQVSPIPTTYNFGTDFAYPTGTVVGDVMASLYAVDLLIAPASPPSTSTSGCEAADFAGFPAGGIALLQRGTCTFELKVQNAQAAGAVGALIFNEGQPGRTEALPFNCGAGCFIPTLSLSFALGFDLSATPGVVIHMVTDLPDNPTGIAEPAPLALLGFSFIGLLIAGRRRP